MRGKLNEKLASRLLNDNRNCDNGYFRYLAPFPRSTMAVAKTLEIHPKPRMVKNY